MTVWTGASGWQYDSWRGPFYPQKLPQPRWLEHYAERFRVVEVNNTFYQLPPKKTFSGWRERTPDDFVFVLKCSRYLTHIKRLQDAAEPVQRFMDRAEALDGKLGPVLLQLPPNLEAEPDRLAAALDEFPSKVRVAVEFRHASWFTEEVRRLLEERDVALCLADRRSRMQNPLWRTASWGYIRLHEGRATPRPGYGRRALNSWARRVTELWGPNTDVYVFFNNDAHSCAVRDASVFAHAVARAGHEVTRTP
jgi:uncharacterized protein YecE (DUF72 family)